MLAIPYPKRRPIETTVSLLLKWQHRCLVPPAGALIPNEPPMAAPTLPAGWGQVRTTACHGFNQRTANIL
jgi:hypothetical protein